MAMTSPNNININHHLINDHHEIPKHTLNFFYANVCSILKEGKLEQLKDILKSTPHEVDVIVLTETWLRTCDEIKRAELEGYNHYFSIRNSKNGGGVSIYVKAKLRSSLTFSNFEGGVNYLWVRVNTELDIGGIYNPGGETDGSQFLNQYSNQLKQMRRAIVFGDFNIDLLKSESKTRKYKSTLDDARYELLNKIDVEYSTRDTQHTSTIIDHVCTNLKVSEYHFRLIVIKSKSLSDHNLLYLGVTEITPSGDQGTRKEEGRWNSNGDTIVTGETSEAKSGETRDTNGANAGATKTHKRQPAEKEFMCLFCGKLYVYPMNYITHLKRDHGYTGRVSDYSIVRRCPNCGVPCRRKAYNRHVRKCTEFRRKDTSHIRSDDRRGEGADSVGEQSSRNEDSRNDDGNGSDDSSSNDGSSSGDNVPSNGESSSSDDDNNSNPENAERNAFNILKQLYFSLQSGKMLKK